MGKRREFERILGEGLSTYEPGIHVGVLQQLTGLMDALCLMHNQRFRHGDIKPENILIFLEDEQDKGIGTLKISDMGQARRHQFETSVRSQPTQTRIGTMTYEAPEAVVYVNRPRSRLYDVWSMGCIFFEFIVWLLDGQAGLEGLAQDTKDAMGQAAFFNIKPETRVACKQTYIPRFIGNWRILCDMKPGLSIRRWGTWSEW